ncbi:hypothetical protein GYA25_03195 [Candidatus Woesearchaeota archaeon]|jgi:hypothetical protein|nr:hypothetical protein [Candidatus Woesearchaeota archaeon]
MFKKKLKEYIKKITIVDIGLIKWSSIFFGLFLVSAWRDFSSFVERTHWLLFLVISLGLGLRPLIKFFKK